MAINIKMTPIHHEPRQRLGLTLVEYTVAHAVFFASINPKSPVKGWCSYSKKSIAAFVGISERKVFDIVARLEELGLLLIALVALFAFVVLVPFYWWAVPEDDPVTSPYPVTSWLGAAFMPLVADRAGGSESVSAGS